MIKKYSLNLKINKRKQKKKEKKSEFQSLTSQAKNCGRLGKVETIQKLILTHIFEQYLMYRKNSQMTPWSIEGFERNPQIFWLERHNYVVPEHHLILYRKKMATKFLTKSFVYCSHKIMLICMITYPMCCVFVFCVWQLRLLHKFDHTCKHVLYVLCVCVFVF